MIAVIRHESGTIHFLETGKELAESKYCFSPLHGLSETPCLCKQSLHVVLLGE